VQFGDETYRDNVDLSTEEFYRKLETSKICPTTATASPAHFTQIFNNLAEETTEIMAITLSEKFSAIYATALQGKAMVKKKIVALKLLTLEQGRAHKCSWS
jgi:fatty acid-binding protein DegV